MSSVPRDVRDALPAWLGRLIAIASVNPPGGEAPAAAFLADLLKKEGVESSILEKEPGRANLVATLGEKTADPPVILLSHLDVVAADESRWSVPPFEGRIHDGLIHGRGAVDAKGVAIMHLGAFLALRRRMDRGFRPDRQVFLVASADEENGSSLGAAFLTEHQQYLSAPAVVLTEGGGFALPADEGPFMVVTTGEKGRYRFRVTATGTGGHASCPPEEQAVEKLGRWLSRLGSYRWEIPEYHTLDAFKTLTADRRFSDGGEMVSRFRQYLEQPGIYLDRVHAGGEALNVVPGKAECECEIGVFPPWDEDYLRSRLEEISEGLEVDVEALSFEPGFECGPGSVPFDTVRNSVLGQGGHYTALLPILALGRTDGRFFGRWGSVSFGISPLLPDMPFSEVLKMVHQADEYISRDSLIFGTEVVTNIVCSLCGDT